MKRSLMTMAFFFSGLSILWGQTVDTTISEVLAHPTTWDGKSVRIKGTVVVGLDQFQIQTNTSSHDLGEIWLAYPEGTKAKAGPAAVLTIQLSKNNPSPITPSPSRKAVNLRIDTSFQTFDSLLSTRSTGKGLYLGNPRYSVNATLTGRIDAVEKTGVIRDENGQAIKVLGFGNLNRYKARLVIESISDVSPNEISYDHSTDTDDALDSQKSSKGDPMAPARKAAKSFPSNSEQSVRLKAAIDSYGAEGDSNGVVIDSGIGNVVSSQEFQKGTANSPDGVLFLLKFDFSRLSGDSFAAAITHMGSHISDLRSSKNPSSSVGLCTLENRAWQATLWMLQTSQAKSILLPSGHLAWDSRWPIADREKLMNSGISALLKSFQLRDE